MGQPASRGMCCSIREKEGLRVAPAASLGTPQFTYSEVAVELEKPRFMAFAPLWQHSVSGPGPRRLALASDKVVHVYRVSDESCCRPENQAPATTAPSPVPELTLEYTLHMGARRQVVALSFLDEDASKQLVVSTSSSFGSSTIEDVMSKVGPGHHCVRIWGLKDEFSESSSASQPPRVQELNADDGFLVSLEEHNALVNRLAVNSSYLFTADVNGECKVWHKSRGYANRAAAQLHQGSIDFTVDRLFVYSMGVQDTNIRIWNVPDLTPVITIPTELPKSIYASLLDGQSATNGMRAPEFPDATSSVSPPSPSRCSNSNPLTALTALRRPISRWAGSQGSNRNQHLPKGTLFVAGVLATGSGLPGRGSGILMEWTLGPPEVMCRTAQVAHDLPVVALAYGPYDNGPLITADVRAVFRIWGVTPRLWCSQRIDVGGLAGDPYGLAIAGDPLCQILYTIAGGKRLLLWRQFRPIQSPGGPGTVEVASEGTCPATSEGGAAEDSKKGQSGV